MVFRLLGIFFYLSILLVIGAVASRRMKDIRDYYAAGKRLGYWAAAFSARATGESAWLLLGLTGMGAVVGVHAFWVVLGEIIGEAVAWILMCRRFNILTKRYDSITIPDYLESRFRDTTHALRIISASALAVFVTIYVSAQIDATGCAFESFLGWNYYVGAVVGFSVVLVYIVAGGFLAVVWSDVFQGTLMLLGLIALPLVGLAVVGGFGPLAESLRAIDPGLLSLFGRDPTSIVTIATTISFVCIGLGFMGSPQLFVRYLSIRSPQQIKKGAVVALIWTTLADVGAVLTGILGRSLLTKPGQALEKVLGSGGQDVLPLMTETLLPALLVGLFIAIVLSAIMSTVDSLLVVASSAAVRDFFQKVLHPDMDDKSLIGFSRRATFIIALSALAIALTVAVLTPQRTIFWFVIFGWSGIAATFCPTMILSLFWPGMTKRGAIWAMISGFVCVPLFQFGIPKLPGAGQFFGALSELPPSFLISGIFGIVVSLLDKKGKEKIKGVEKELLEAGRGRMGEAE
jgi:sodium/proline symporter